MPWKRKLATLAALSTLLLPALCAPAIATAQAQPATPRTTTVDSQSWSGYEVAGTYTVVTGTFTVPSLTTGVPLTGEAAEWIGLDGYGNDNLLQAGVGLYGSECRGASPEGVSANPGNVFYICPWVFEYQNGVPTQPSIPILAVGVGDSVKVELWQIGPGQWGVYFKDITTGATWCYRQLFVRA